MTTLVIDTDKLLQWEPVAQTDAELHGAWQPTDTHRNTWPASLTYDTRVDIKMRDGTVFKNCRAYTWSWGEARETTITHWRIAK